MFSPAVDAAATAIPRPSDAAGRLICVEGRQLQPVVVSRRPGNSLSFAHDAGTHKNYRAAFFDRYLAKQFSVNTTPRPHQPIVTATDKPANKGEDHVGAVL
jgi:hypothetical protein